MDMIAGNTAYADANVALRALKGTSVLDMGDSSLRTQVINVIRKIADNYGYGEMITPIIYEKSLLTYKFEEGSELADEIYSVSDRGERDLGLRYDLTVPFARFVAENAKSFSYPFKRFEIGEVFRDGPVKSGRSRQFTQCDMDVVCDIDPVITAYEQISMMVAVFDALGLGDVKIKYSSRRAAEGMLRLIGVEERDIRNAVRVMDKKDKLEQVQYAEALREAGLDDNTKEKFDGWLDLSADGLLTAWENEKAAGKTLSSQETEDMFEAGIGELSSLARLIGEDERLRERCVFDLSLVRGQDYYTGIMFEAFAPDFPSSLAGGGRYDSIIGAFAGEQDDKYSASGVSFGIVPIMCLIKSRFDVDGGDGDTEPRRGVVIITCSEDDVPSALRLSNASRKNKRVEVDTASRSVSKKMKSANKAGYAYVVVYGDQERESGVLTVKNMTSGLSTAMYENAFVEADEDMLALFIDDA